VNFSDVDARAKHYFSLYQKLLRYNMDVDKIYDLVALRIIVPDVKACYHALGVVHKIWPPLTGRIKDYIAYPKQNGYRSLHTTVFCQEKQMVEIQIKTPAMHKEAEFGAASHLSYKTKIPEKAYRHQFYWMDTLRKWRDEIKDPEKIKMYLTNEMFKDRIFALTPKKEIIDLPKGSTIIDFAYAVHSEIGDHCEGAKVNGKMVSLNTEVKTGDVIEIITSKAKVPSSDWLRVVKTQKARSKIRSFLEKAYGISLAKPGKVIKQGVSRFAKILPRKIKKKQPGVEIAGQTGIAFRLSKCCKPQENDEIVAFVTKGEGASLHKAQCKNLKGLQEKWPERIVPAVWKNFL